MSSNSLSQLQEVRLRQALTANCVPSRSATDNVDLLIVFGCAEPQVAIDASELYKLGLVKVVLFTGGFGKDSGPLAKVGIREADFLASIALSLGVSHESILLEREATNGAENVELSLELAGRRGLLSPSTKVGSLASVVRCRRLGEELRYQAQFVAPNLRLYPPLSSGELVLDTSDVVKEALEEIRGLRTMSDIAKPRINRLPEFHDDGQFSDVASLALAQV